MQLLLKIFLTILICLFNIRIAFSQEETLSTEKWFLVRSNTEVNTYLDKMKLEQDRIFGKLRELQTRQSQLEIERDRSEQVSSEIMNEANKLQMESDFLNNEIKNLRAELLKIQTIVEKKYFKNLYGVSRYIGKAKIYQGDKVFANVSVINSDFTIEGIVKGDLAAVNSNVYLASDAKIDGKITIINSSIYSAKENNNLNLSLGEIESTDEPYNEWASEDVQYSYNFNPPSIRFLGVTTHSAPVLRYNRVEGLYIGMKNQKKYSWNGIDKHSIYGKFGYAFSNHIWTGDVNLDLWIGNYNRTEIGGEGHVLIDSKDNWLIGEEENTFSSFFIKEDFKDYFKKEGWSIHLAQYINKNLRVKMEYVHDKYYSAEKKTDWALFGGDKKFRFNPGIDEGEMNSAIFSINYISVRGKDKTPNGWNVGASYEIGRGYFDFRRAIVDLRRYQKLSDDIRLNMRLAAGSSENYLPLQRTFDLGGLGTIPALRFKELRGGNRMLLGNAELIVNIPDGDDFLPFEIFNGHDLILFYDIGSLRYARPETSILDGFENLTMDDFVSDLGVALSFNRGSIRIGASFRLDRSESAKFFLRLTQPF